MTTLQTVLYVLLGLAIGVNIPFCLDAIEKGFR